MEILVLMYDSSSGLRTKVVFYVTPSSSCEKEQNGPFRIPGLIMIALWTWLCCLGDTHWWTWRPRGSSSVFYWSILLGSTLGVSCKACTCHFRAFLVHVIQCPALRISEVILQKNTPNTKIFENTLPETHALRVRVGRNKMICSWMLLYKFQFLGVL